jgi:hypothetical protein
MSESEEEVVIDMDSSVEEVTMEMEETSVFVGTDVE